jgi:hypothetical protein
VTTGRESGRVVRLRAIGDNVPLQVNDVVAGARTLTHPELVKLLGIVFDGRQYYLASEHLPGVALFELIGRARARRQGFEIAAAVHVTITALRLVEQAAGLLGAAGLPRTRLFYTDSIWIAEFGETLLAEPGLAAQLGGGAPELGAQAVQRDTLTAAVELYHLASGKLLTGDLAAAVKEALPEPLAHALTDVFSWSDTEASDTVSSFGRALGRLPPELRGDDAGVARALRRLAADVLSERERKLAEYRPGLGVAIDGPTRVYSMLDQGVEPDEATVVHGRRLQPGRHELGARPVPDKHLAQVMALVARKPRAQPKNAEMRTQPAASTRDSKPSTGDRKSTLPKKASWKAFVLTLLAILALFALVFIARTHPAWIRELGARIKFALSLIRRG